MLLLADVAPVPAAPVCAVREDARAAIQRLRETMESSRFIAYQPTELKVIEGRLTRASAESIRADLVMLRPWFDGLITYGVLNGAERIPDIAAELGYRAVIVGMWNPGAEQEVANVLAAADRNPDLVVGIGLGNEMVLGGRAEWRDLERFLRDVQNRAPYLPLAVTETFARFLDDPEARGTLELMDFMLVNVHPVFEPWFAHSEAPDRVRFVLNVTERLADLFCGPILVKETGVPTGPAELGYSPEAQRDFYRALEAALPPARRRAFAYFSAFDAPWRVHDFHPMPGHHPEEAFWGLFSDTREPKAVMQGLRPLAAPAVSGAATAAQ